MSLTKAREYAIRLSVEGGRAVTAEFARVGNAGDFEMGKVEKRSAKTTAALRAAKVAAIGLAGALVTGLAASTRTAVSDLADLGNTADKLGIAAEALQELRYAGEQFNITSANTDLAMQRFIRRVAEAQQGAGELLPTLKQYNIELKDSEGRNRAATDILLDYADAIKGAESEQEQLRMAFKAFDSEGAALVNIMKEGRDGLAAYSKEARDSGQVISNELIKKAQDFDNALNNLMRTITIRFKGGLVEFASDVVDAFHKAEYELKEFIYQAEMSARNSKIGSLLGFSGDMPDASHRKEWNDYIRKRLEEIRGGGGDSDGASGADIMPPGLSSKGLAALDKQLQGLRERVELLNVEGRARAQLAAVLKAEAVARAEGLELTTEQRKQVEDLAGAVYDLEKAEKDRADAAREAEKAARDAARETERLAKEAEREAERKAEEIKRRYEHVLGGFGDFLNETFNTGKISLDSFNDALKSTEQLLTEIAVKQAILNPATNYFQGASGGGGLLSGFLSFLPGFATGGDITVGGAPGVDRNVLSLNGTPVARVSQGETVSVRPGGGGDGTVIQQFNTYNLMQGDLEGVQRSQAQSGARLKADLDRSAARNR